MPDPSVEEAAGVRPDEGEAAKDARPKKSKRTPVAGTPIETPLAEEGPTARRRVQRPFPAAPFEETIEFARTIFQVGSGQPVRRLTLFDHLSKSPDSGGSRQLITNSNKYGLTKGSYASDYLELTDDGKKAADEQLSKREQQRTWAKLAVLDIDPFRQVYERFLNARLPARAVLIDALKDAGISPNAAEEGADTLIVNLRFVGLLQTVAGAERIVSLDHMLDGLPATTSVPTAVPSTSESEQRSLVTQEHAEFETTCFYVTPIGEDGSEERKHSDLFLGSFVEPAVQQFNLRVVRADAIDKPGMITRQVIEFIVRSRLVIADLSFHNPNVFCELALRHATRMPIVQIIRAGDKLPFDIHQMRTIVIDNRDIYTAWSRRSRPIDPRFQAK
jgi:hypothetical protein